MLILKCVSARAFYPFTSRYESAWGRLMRQPKVPVEVLDYRYVPGETRELFHGPEKACWGNGTSRAVVLNPATYQHDLEAY